MDSAARLCDSGYGLFELAIIEDTTTNSETVMISVKDDFFHNTFRLDDIRGEDFFRTFPELQPLQDTYK